jgi:hypothetical protein
MFYDIYQLTNLKLKNMRKISIVFTIWCLTAAGTFAQSKANDISVDKLPTAAKTVLDRYVKILSESASIDDCAVAFLEIAGGGLVNPDFPISLRSDIKQFSLKKDFDNIKFYQNPAVITRVNVSKTNGNGYGATAVKGTIYKIWIQKKAGVAGMPAPVQVLVPEGNDKITTPKIVNIGSF